jgi:glycosyltransferase involved in cell wall biosynthesis
MTGTAPIKLLVDAHVFDGEYQGSRTFINDLYVAMSKREGVELYIGAYDTKNLEKYFGNAPGIHFIKFRSRSGWIRLAYDIPRIIRKYGIGYAHFQYIVPLFKNSKFIVTTHDVLFNEYPREFSFWFRKTKNFLYKRSAHKADILTTDSEYSKRSIQKYLHIPARNINVLYPGINQAFFAPYNKQEARNMVKEQFGIGKFILYVSRFEPRKNHGMLLQAWLDLNLYEQGYHLVMLGHQSTKVEAFEQMLDEVPATIRPFIFINGKLDNSALLQFYRAADVFVYPSLGEGFGLPPLEAGAAKVPVLCSNSSAMADFSFFNENHIDPANCDQFRSRLSSILQNGVDQASLNTIAETIRERYSAETAADDLLQLIMNDNIKTQE